MVEEAILHEAVSYLGSVGVAQGKELMNGNEADAVIALCFGIGSGRITPLYLADQRPEQTHLRDAYFMLRRNP